MKQLFLLFLTATLFFACSPDTPPQPRADYEIFSNTISGGSKYSFFAEKKVSGVPYKLVQGMDYLSPSVLALKVGESTTAPVFTINLLNDGSEYAVGVVVQNSAGFYSGMGVSTGTVGVVPLTPGGVGLRKK